MDDTTTTTTSKHHQPQPSTSTSSTMLHGETQISTIMGGWTTIAAIDDVEKKPECKERRKRIKCQTFVSSNKSWFSSTSSSSSSSSSTSSTAFLLVLLIVLPCLLLSRTAQAVRCYCTDEHCVPYGVCEAAVCLVGLLRASNAVIRTCGNEPLGCQRNLDRWSHICSCEEHFCNTFLFLKASTSIDGGVPAGQMRDGGGGPPVGGGGGIRPHPHLQQQSRHAAEEFEEGDDRRVFERVDSRPGDFATFDHTSFDDEEERGTIKNSNLLTLLLVIVPLSVGAAAVVVVAINYYCHLC